MGFSEVLWARDQVPEMTDLNPAARFVLMTLASRVNPQTGQCNPSVETIASSTGLSRRGIQRALLELEGAGVLRRTYADGKSTSYTMVVTVEGDMSAPLNDCTGDMSAPQGRHECAGGGDMSAPKRKVGKETETKETESAGASDGCHGCGTRVLGEPCPHCGKVCADDGFRVLEAALLDCMPPQKRRGFGLDRQSVLIAQGLWEKHGLKACMAAVAECGGADRPAYMLRSRLERPAHRGPNGRAAPSRAGIDAAHGVRVEDQLAWNHQVKPGEPAF